MAEEEKEVVPGHIISPHTQIMINKKRMRASDVYDINLYTSIWEILPKLSFKLNDPTGKLLAELNIVEGAEVQIATIDLNYHSESVTLEENPDNDEEIEKENAEKLDSLNFVTPYIDTDFFPTSFIIKEIFTGFEASSPTAGWIQIECIQAWDIYVRAGLSGYRGKISEIIRNVLKKSIKDHNYIDLSEIEGSNEDGIDYLNDSSDNGKSLRHPAGLSDLDFIEKRLVPYLNIQNKPGYFFIDEFGRPHISNFDLMYSSKAKLFLYNNKNINDAQAKILAENLESSDTDSKLPVSSLVCEFGQNKNFVQILNTHVNFKAGDTTAKTSQNLATQSKFISEGNLDKVLPFNKLQWEAIESSRFSFTPSFIPDDDKELLRINAFKNSDREIVIKIKTNYLYKDLRPGDSIELYTPYFEEKSHWLNGKWVCGAINFQVLKDTMGIDSQNSMEITAIRKFIPWKDGGASSIADAGMLI